jgi:two-component system, OmpR family, response regulator
MRILIIDDDPQISDFIRHALTDDGFEVDVALSGEDGLRRATEVGYDGIILDVVLPDTTGLHVAARLREVSRRTPILMLTSRGGTEDVVSGLDAGADDYLVKPFRMEELRARCRALVRRGTGGAAAGEEVLRTGDLAYDRLTRRATVNGQRIKLTPKESRLLEVLMASAGQVVSRAELLEKVWEIRFDPHSNIVDVHTTRLRQKLRRLGSTARLVTVRGTGFMITGGDGA